MKTVTDEQAQRDLVQLLEQTAASQVSSAGTAVEQYHGSRIVFKFGKSACVALESDNPKLGLMAGDTGVVWAMAETQPPAYEVTSRTQEGEGFDALTYEEGLTEPAPKGGNHKYGPVPGVGLE